MLPLTSLKTMRVTAFRAVFDIRYASEPPPIIDLLRSSGRQNDLQILVGKLPARLKADALRRPGDDGDTGRAHDVAPDRTIL